MVSWLAGRMWTCLVLLPRNSAAHARTFAYFLHHFERICFVLLTFRQVHGRPPWGATGPASARSAVLARFRDARGIRLFMFPGPCATRTTQQHPLKHTCILDPGRCPMPCKTWPVDTALALSHDFASCAAVEMTVSFSFLRPAATRVTLSSLLRVCKDVCKLPFFGFGTIRFRIAPPVSLHFSLFFHATKSRLSHSFTHRHIICCDGRGS
jgi:hypothetical protein